jgi:hypothetical protein
MISWASPNEPLPMIRDPRMAFDQLFGAGGSTRERAARRRATTSVLDYITGQVADLNKRLDPSDRQRMDRYLDDVREVERRIQKVEARNMSGEGRELPGAPAGVPSVRLAQLGHHITQLGEGNPRGAADIDEVFGGQPSNGFIVHPNEIRRKTGQGTIDQNIGGLLFFDAKEEIYGRAAGGNDQRIETAC